MAGQTSIVVVGNEILDGHTKDTNTQYLLERLFDLGRTVRRVTVVPDEEREIVAAVRECLKAGDSYVFVCGGLGTTPDDITYAAVARALDRPAALSRTAVSAVRSSFARKGRPLDDVDPKKDAGIAKICTVPKGARVLENPVGYAPGLVVKDTKTTLFVLPGVPAEHRALLDGRILGKLLKADPKRPHLVELSVRCTERSMRDILEGVVRDWPSVRLGSYPRAGTVLLRMSGPRAQALAAARELAERLAERFGADVLGPGGPKPQY